MDKKKAEDLFVEVAGELTTAEEILDKLRDYNSMEILSDEEYNFLLEEWDNLLKDYGIV